MENNFSEELEWLYRAAAAPLGLSLRVTDFARVRQRFYAARRTVPDDTKLAQLQILQSPYDPQNLLWIVNSKIDLVELGGPTDAEE